MKVLFIIAVSPLFINSLVSFTPVSVKVLSAKVVVPLLILILPSRLSSAKDATALVF